MCLKSVTFIFEPDTDFNMSENDTNFRVVGRCCIVGGENNVDTRTPTRTSTRMRTRTYTRVRTRQETHVRARVYTSHARTYARTYMRANTYAHLHVHDTTSPCSFPFFFWLSHPHYHSPTQLHFTLHFPHNQPTHRPTPTHLHRSIIDHVLRTPRYYLFIQDGPNLSCGKLKAHQ